MSLEKVFILGSGFSKNIINTFPTVADLTVRAWKKLNSHLTGNVSPQEESAEDRNNKTAASFLSETGLLNLIDPNFNEGQQSFWNIEDLLTYLYQDFPWKNNKEKHLSLFSYHILSEMIVKELGQEINVEKILKKHNYLTDLLNLVHKYEYPVITLNYDLILEALAEHILKNKLQSGSFNPEIGTPSRIEIRISKEFPSYNSGSQEEIHCENIDGEKLRLICKDRQLPQEEFLKKIAEQLPRKKDQYYSSIFNVYNQLSENIAPMDLYRMPLAYLAQRTASLMGGNRKLTFHLIKLHGSINWYYSGASEYSGQQIYLTQEKMNIDLQSINKVDLVPLIIPPVLDKSSFYFSNTIKTLWEAAKISIQNADEIYLLGYSLPQTDLPMRYLLQSYLKWKKAKIFVVNKVEKVEEENISNRFRSIFGENFNDQYLGSRNVIKSLIDDIAENDA